MNTKDITYRQDAVSPYGINQREVYLNEALHPNEFEESNMFKIREYYEGRQLTDELTAREAYVAPALYKLLSDFPLFNMVNRTVKVISERLTIDNISSKDPNKAEIAKEWWDKAEMDSWQSVIYETALRDKAMVLIVGWNGVEKRPTFTINELWDGVSGTCRIHYDNNENISFISKRWHQLEPDGRFSGRFRLTIYLPDRIERFVLEGLTAPPRLMTIEELKLEDENIVSNPEMLLDANGNPLGMPAIVFENKGYLSECFEAMAAQAGVNEAILDWHTTSRYHGMPTVVFSGVQFKIDPLTGRNIEPKWSPGKGIAIDSGDVKRIHAEDIKRVYEGSVMPWIEIVTRAKGWPEHVFTQIPPSGETIRQMEGSLVSQCDAKKSMFNDSWKRAFEIAFKFSGLYSPDQSDADLEFHWKSSLSISEKYDLQLLALKKSVLGLPQKIVLLEAGYSPEQADIIIEETNREKLKNAQFNNLAINANKNPLDAPNNPAGARGIIGNNAQSPTNKA